MTRLLVSRVGSVLDGYFLFYFNCLLLPMFSLRFVIDFGIGANNVVDAMVRRDFFILRMAGLLVSRFGIVLD